jgi:hypothetical protein
MDWTDEQKQKVFEAYWEDGEPHCPVCTASARSNLSETLSGYWLDVTCPRGCGRLLMSRNDDPRKPTFRVWTKEEITQIVNRHFNRDFPCCPIDGATLEIEESPTNVENRLFASCPRCGARCQEVFSISK